MHLKIQSHKNETMPAPLASRPRADHFQTGDTDVPMRQRDRSAPVTYQPT